MDIRSNKIFKTLNPRRVWIPIFFGLAVVFYMFYSDKDITLQNLKSVFDAKFEGIVIAILVLLARDIGYMYRIRTITNKSLSWINSMYVIILWEFASAVTPSVVGGTAVAVFILTKEGINLGKSLAYVMLTAILDNLFFVVTAPIFLAISGGMILSDVSLTLFDTEFKLNILFLISYSLIAVYTLIMAYALFIRPRAFKYLLLKITSIRFLKRWRYDAFRQGDEMIMASSILKGNSLKYWMQIIGATIFIWSARYLMLNSLIASYADINFSDHLTIFAKQVIMWIIMLISPTPGSTGTAEISFAGFFSEFLGDYTFVTSILWRMLSYYPYLLLGAIFLPRWIRKVFFKTKQSTEA